MVAWHEGGANGTEKTMEVTVPAKGSAPADFSFGASALGQPSSLQMMPAIEFPMLDEALRSLRISNCELRIGAERLFNPQSQIRNPKSLCPRVFIASHCW